MEEQNPEYKNEFEQPLSNNAIEQFNTLQGFSPQATGLLETTLADTLGLSMHNAITNQQQSQMTTAASVTNACARLLQTQAQSSSSNNMPPPATEPAIVVNPNDRLGTSLETELVVEEAEKSQKKFSLFGFLKMKKGAEDE
ncbi:RebB family R body protein [Vibrio sp. NTOU-M3]|uniref:RebB family R body protein n=1 Tax=Vibrio sp. NTOU-M3 TaxID=3234954 RepID=UPI00349F376F